jgi:two-component system, sensor histidine kinase PdtaS
MTNLTHIPDRERATPPLEGQSDWSGPPRRNGALANSGRKSIASIAVAVEQAQLARTPSGLPFVGDLVWGEHFCQFYETAEDLRDCLVPYFKAGLDNNEKCLWVASEPFGKIEALAALRAIVPYIDAAIARGQIEIIDHAEWYLRQGAVRPEELPFTWLARMDEALAEGYRGLRVTGNAAFLEPTEWKSFMDYEEAVHRCFHGHRIIAVCSYPLRRASATQVLEVIRSHGFAILRRSGQWESVESAALAAAKNQLESANLDLERSVQERTAGLQAALVERMSSEAKLRASEEKAKLLAREVNHRANNLLTLIGAIMRQTRAETVPEFISSMQGRINALARVQTRLARDQWDRTDLRKLIGEELAPFANDISRRFRIAGPDVPLGPDAAQALAITIHELAMNAVKYGSLSNPVGRVAIEWAISGEQLTLSWTETGGPATYRPNREGFGTRAISVLAQQLGGSVSVDWRRAGLVCTLAIPVQSVKA